MYTKETKPLSCSRSIECHHLGSHKAYVRRWRNRSSNVCCIAPEKRAGVVIFFWGGGGGACPQSPYLCTCKSTTKKKLHGLPL